LELTEFGENLLFIALGSHFN